MLRHVAQIGHDRLGPVAPLLLQLGEIHGSGVEPGRCPGFQTVDPQRKLPQPLCQRLGRGVAGPSSGVIIQPHMNFPAQESTDREHDR